MINLTEDDVDFDGKKIKLENRTILISQETLSLVKNALNEDIYYSINGENVRKYKIIESNYVLRGLKRETKVTAHIISQRIFGLAKQYDYEYLNATNVFRSGRLHYARKS